VYTTRDGLPNDDLTKLFEDSRGDIWIASFVPEREPLARWDRATNRIQRYGESDGLRPFTSALVFGEDKRGRVWIGFREGGIARFRDGRFTVFRSESGMPEGSVEGLYQDPASDRFWLAVPQAGLCRVDRLDDDRPGIEVYGREQGLTSDRVMAVTGDREGRIYAAHIRGVDRLDPASGNVQRYSSADGLPIGDFRFALRDRRGALWFSTTSGLSRFTPGPEKPAAPPRILIGGVQVAGSSWGVAPLGQDTVAIRDLEPDGANLQIEFFGLDLRAGETLRYQYRLEGTRSDWSRPSTQRTINYASLGSGTYRFLVRAVSADGTPSAQPASVSFAVLPPVWLRWWFLGLVASGIATAVAGFIYSRTRYLRARQRATEAIRRSREERLAELERVRTRIATDLHDDVGSSLTRISLLSEVVQQRLHSSDTAVVEPLSSIAGLSRELVDSMSDIVWAINPNKDHLSDLSQRMRHFASDLFTARQIAFRFHTPDPEHDTALGANIRRELFLIFKEAVNNVVRHSGCGEAELDLRTEPGALVLRVHDNGRGFDASATPGGHGLISMRRRAEGLGGELRIASEPGAGTTLTVRIPT
jgi:signal transduction histidine kinase